MKGHPSLVAFYRYIVEILLYFLNDGCSGGGERETLDC